MKWSYLDRRWVARFGHAAKRDDETSYACTKVLEHLIQNENMCAQCEKTFMIRTHRRSSSWLESPKVIYWQQTPNGNNNKKKMAKKKQQPISIWAKQKLYKIEINRNHILKTKWKEIETARNINLQTYNFECSNERMKLSKKLMANA